MKNYSLFAVLFVCGSLLLTGCQGDERIAEVSTKQFEAEQKAKSVLVAQMETDLSRRQRFYQGVAGTYEGTAVGKTFSYKIRIRLVASVPPMEVNRVRMQEEVASDLNNLHLSAQVVLWSDQGTGPAVGCQISGIKPDVDNGRIEFAPSECGNYFLIQINDKSISTNSRVNNPSTTSRIIARKLMVGSTPQVPGLTGIIQPNTSSEVMSFSAERVSQ